MLISVNYTDALKFVAQYRNQPPGLYNPNRLKEAPIPLTMENLPTTDEISSTEQNNETIEPAAAPLFALTENERANEQNLERNIHPKIFSVPASMKNIVNHDVQANQRTELISELSTMTQEMNSVDDLALANSVTLTHSIADNFDSPQEIVQEIVAGTVHRNCGKYTKSKKKSQAPAIRQSTSQMASTSMSEAQSIAAEMDIVPDFGLPNPRPNQTEPAQAILGSQPAQLLASEAVELKFETERMSNESIEYISSLLQDPASIVIDDDCIMTFTTFPMPKYDADLGVKLERDSISGNVPYFATVCSIDVITLALGRFDFAFLYLELKQTILLCLIIIFCFY